MNRYQEDGATLIFLGVGIVCVFFGLVFWDYQGCYNKAQMMGMKSNYGLTTGCMVEVEPSKWRDIEAVREVK